MKQITALAFAAILLLPSTALAQEETDNSKKLKAHVSAALVSKYMWRGIDRGGVSIQPEAGISWRGLSLWAEGNAGFNHDEQEEIDLHLQFERWGFNIGVTDYWQTGIDPEGRYFYYDAKNGPHAFEANLGYTFKYASIQAYTVFAGNDFKINGKRAYSTFIELTVPFRLGGLDWDAKVGICPMESAGYTYTTTVQGLISEYTVTNSVYEYGEGFCCNMASLRATKEFSFKHIKLPVFAELHTNPYLKKANFLVGAQITIF